MGNYNPHVPQILGEEWVPIREQVLTLNPFANTVERGYGFTLSADTQVSAVRFYLREFPPFFGSSMIYTASIYPRGRENESGPIRSVIIPCNYAQITGNGSSNGPTLIFAGLTPADCLYARGDNYFLYWIMGNASPLSRQGVDMYFATNAYASLLSGKRILGVDFLSAINIVSQGFDMDTISQNIMTYVRTDFDSTATDTFRLPNLLSNQTPVSTIADIRMHLGDANRFFGVGSGTSAGINMISQWTYPELQRFEASAANRLHIALEEFPTVAAVGPQWQLEYAALEVFYCEESRTVFGSRIFNDDIPNRPSRDAFNLGENQITVRDATTFVTNPIIPAGNYTVTISESNMGDNFYAAQFRSTANLNQVRQLYRIPSHPGVQINLPFPIDSNVIDSTFTSESTDLIPQLTLQASGGAVITDSHVYGEPYIAPVYGSTVATQFVIDTAISSAQFPWVRFYARRFGDTTAPLKLDSLSPTVSGSNYTVRITPAEFDALGDAIVDGWKEVTLRFPVPPVMGAGVQPVWRWSAFGEFIGSRWEVLGAAAPAVSGIPQQMDINLQLAEVPKAQRLYAGAYGGAGNVLASAFIGAGAAAHADNASVTPGLPAGLLTQFNNGQYVTLLVWAAIRSSGTGTVDTPPGYTKLFSSGNVAMFGKIWNGTEGAPTITFSNGVAGDSTSAQMAAFTNISLFNMIQATQLNASAQNINYPGIVTVDNSLLLFTGWKQDDWTSVATLGGLTAIGDPSTVLGNDQGIVWQFVLAGPITIAPGAFAVTGGANAISRGSLLALRQIGGHVADSAIIFSQDMPTVTGFSVSVASQALTGIGLNCGIAPCGIPTAVNYNQLSWGSIGNSVYVNDQFLRAATGWGSATTGQVYTDSGGTVEGNYITDGTVGTHVLDGADNTARNSVLTTVFENNSHHRVKISINQVTTGASARAGIIFNYRDASNYDFVDFRFAVVNQAMEIVISKQVAGVTTGLTNVAAGNFGVNQQWWADVDVTVDGTIRAKAWPVGGKEPTEYQATATATFSSGAVGLRSIRSTGNTNTGLIISYDDYTVGASTWSFGYLELQRMDPITDWATIMKAASPAITGFKDFEARVGMASSYRIRGVDVYNFPGQWSSTVSITSASPGVSGSCLSDAHVMIFTTNEKQNGSSNLAYSNAWESDVTEDFAFAESGFVQLQPMYNRDFFTAFHPSERGGDQFSRNLLVQAAAISPETLADFTSLRDMAWADVPYVCIRDEDGNRWFANVAVPAAVVKNNRKLYLATIQITEVTATPSPADPTS